MEKIIKLNTNRSEYDILEAAKSSITVRQFVDELLNNYDEDAKIVFSNDNGYTYGYVTECGIEEELVESREERERREKMEELDEELVELQAEYENPEYCTMSTLEYRKEREDLFKTYGISEEEYNNFFGYR